VEARGLCCRVYEAIKLSTLGFLSRCIAGSISGLYLELWPKVGEGVNRGRRHIVGVFEPPLLHRRSDMPCPTIPLSN
jgi:hypothetical protein